MLGFFAAFLMVSSIGHAADPTTSATPAEIEMVPVSSDLSQRLNRIQTNKDCIHNAKTKADVEKCRGSIQIKRDRR